MISLSLKHSLATSEKLSDYLTLCKYKVVLLLVITAWAGMGLAPIHGSLIQQLLSLLGIGFLASAAAVCNHIIDRNIDKKMARTHRRPLVQSRVSKAEATALALVLSILGVALLETFANRLTTLLTLSALLAYAVFYSVYLKWATPQNIVIGGIAGAMPPLLGWVSQTNSIDPQAWLLVLIIFTWTPPHFWALAIHRRADYAQAEVPMLPVTHGIHFCKIITFLYTVLLFLICLLPYLIDMSGLIYLTAAVILNSIFIYKAGMLLNDPDNRSAYDLFRYSIVHLTLLFLALYADKIIL